MPSLEIAFVEEKFKSPYFDAAWEKLDPQQRTQLVELVSRVHAKKLDWFETDTRDLRAGRKLGNFENAKPIFCLVTFANNQINVVGGTEYDARKRPRGGFHPFVWGDGSEAGKKFGNCLTTAAAAAGNPGRLGLFPNDYR
jgi:hypothetical protein